MSTKRTPGAHEPIERITPGINVGTSLDRLRFSTNRPQKNTIIDDAIEQVNKDQAAFAELLEACKQAMKVWPDHMRGSMLEAAVAKAEAK